MTATSRSGYFACRVKESRKDRSVENFEVATASNLVSDRSRRRYWCGFCDRRPSISRGGGRDLGARYDAALQRCTDQHRHPSSGSFAGLRLSPGNQSGDRCVFWRLGNLEKCICTRGEHGTQRGFSSDRSLTPKSRRETFLQAPRPGRPVPASPRRPPEEPSQGG